MQKVPSKTPDFFNSLLSWINQSSALIAAVFLAIATAFTREKRAGTNTILAFEEALICACLSIGAITALEYLELPDSLAQLFGVFIGFLGTRKICAVITVVANLVMGVIKKRFGIDKDTDK